MEDRTEQASAAPETGETTVEEGSATTVGEGGEATPNEAVPNEPTHDAQIVAIVAAIVYPVALHVPNAVKLAKQILDEAEASV